MKTTKERRKEKRLKIEGSVEELRTQLINKVKKLEEENHFLRIELEKYKNESKVISLNYSVKDSEHEDSGEFYSGYIIQLENENKDFKNQILEKERYIHQLEVKNEKLFKAVQQIEIDLESREQKILLLDENIDSLNVENDHLKKITQGINLEQSSINMDWSIVEQYNELQKKYDILEKAYDEEFNAHQILKNKYSATKN